MSDTLTPNKRWYNLTFPAFRFDEVREVLRAIADGEVNGGVSKDTRLAANAMLEQLNDAANYDAKHFPQDAKQ
jgi:hypothetical protein